MTKKTFEQAIKQLEQIVNELESNDIPLEKAMKKFEEGVKLSKDCGEILDETEKKINLLLKNSDGDIIENPFFSDEDDIVGNDTDE